MEELPLSLSRCISNKNKPRILKLMSNSYYEQQQKTTHEFQKFSAAKSSHLYFHLLLTFLISPYIHIMLLAWEQLFRSKWGAQGSFVSWSGQVHRALESGAGSLVLEWIFEASTDVIGSVEGKKRRKRRVREEEGGGRGLFTLWMPWIHFAKCFLGAPTGLDAVSTSANKTDEKS